MNKCKLICCLFFLMSNFSMQVFARENSMSPDLKTVKDPANLINHEISRLDNLIQATQQSLEGQKRLRDCIVEYQRIQNLYLQNTNDNELLFQMVKSAYRTLSSIKENHLTQTFDIEFISELTMLSQIATKRGIPKP